ncbi:MAG: molybdopterin cofactor-binding domain-containing protein [Streptosporangiaceae bacterium]
MASWSIHSYGALFCEVRVNTVTGETRVSRFLGSFDCGRIINPKTAASQFRGSIIMGLGMALMEETLFDERERGPQRHRHARPRSPDHAGQTAVRVTLRQSGSLTQVSWSRRRCCHQRPVVGGLIVAGLCLARPARRTPGPCAERADQRGSFACGGPVARAPTRCRYPGRCHARAR